MDLDMQNKIQDDGSANAKSESLGGATRLSRSVTNYLTGWRLIVTTVGVLLCLYLVNIEVTIVSTSLVSITNDLHGFEKTNWIVTGYLITYTGFIIIWTKLSDIFGRKAAIIAAMILFSAFSGGCGGAQTINQLIIFRSLQGVGAAGAYSMSILTVYDMVPKNRLALNGVFISMAVSGATLTGPIFAGVINEHSTWRWVFFMNVPAGIVAVALLAVSIPAGFGTASPGTNAPNFNVSQALAWHNIRRLDFLGAGLLLSASLLLVAALQETAIEFTWSSGATIAMLTLSGLCWITFCMWEWYLTERATSYIEPVFPWRFMRSRPWVGMLITTFLVGSPYNVVVVAIPQRLQTVSAMSVLDAGIRLIPFSLSGALSSALANMVCSRFHIPPFFFLLLGAALNLTGLSLLSSLPLDDFPRSGYAYEAITASGIGCTFGILVLATPFMVAARDLAVATGAIIQFRFLGGAIGLSIASNILNSALRSKLAGLLDADTLRLLLDNIDVIKTLTPDAQVAVKEVFSRAYRTQFLVTVGFAAAQIPAAFLLLKRGRQIRAIEM